MLRWISDIREKKRCRGKEAGGKMADGRGEMGRHFHLKIGESTHLASLQYIMWYYDIKKDSYSKKAFNVGVLSGCS